MIFLGIDTSAYTTSICTVDNNGHIVKDKRRLLEVPKGKRGLRQSEALFQHVKNLPEIFEEIFSDKAPNFAAIGVSAWPRRVAGSYMPVFNAGLANARVIASCTATPLYQVSHQEGHIMAAMYNNMSLMNTDRFLAVHFSGGTSELLVVRKNSLSSMTAEVYIEGNDLHAGQLVDRVGVKMGMPFPAGKYLEEKARQSLGLNLPVIPSSVSEKGFSFSGAETRALQLLQDGWAQEEIACALLRTIANTLEKIIVRAAVETGIKDVLLAGGVMSNSLIKDRLRERLEHPAKGMKLYFSNPGLSTDNAAGVALLAYYLHSENSINMNKE